MVDIHFFRRTALSFPDTEEQPHFHLTSFRIKKKIFATWWEKENRAMLKLTAIDQSVFCDADKANFYPVPGSWGKQGATFVELKKVRRDVFKDALSVAYQSAAESAVHATKKKGK